MVPLVYLGACWAEAGLPLGDILPHTPRPHSTTLSILFTPLPEIIDPVFAKTSPKRSFCMTENERIGLVFVKTGSINSGTCVATQIKKKPHIQGNSEWISCKVIGWLTASSWGNICAFPHILGSRSSWLCNSSTLNFHKYICEDNFLFYQCTPSGWLCSTGAVERWKWCGFQWLTKFCMMNYLKG